MKSKSPKAALFVALCLFGGLMYIMNPVKKEEPMIMVDTFERHPFRVQVEMRGFLENLAFDHILVGDTIAHYASAALPEGKGFTADWTMNYCCEEQEENPEAFQWWAEFGFSKGGDRMALLKRLSETDLLQLEFSELTDDGTLVGIAHANLPIPGREGVLELSSVAFNFRTVFG